MEEGAGMQKEMDMSGEDGSKGGASGQDCSEVWWR